MTVDTKKLRQVAVKLRALIQSPDHAAFEMARAEYRVLTHPDTLLDLLDKIEDSRHVLAGLPQDAIDGGWTALGMSNYAKRLETRRNELLLEIDALRKDAERYRWLEKRFRVFGLDIDGKHTWAPLGDVVRIRGVTFGAAIDAALALRESGE